MVSILLYIFKLLNINLYKHCLNDYNFLPNGLCWSVCALSLSFSFVLLNKVKIYNSSLQDYLQAHSSSLLFYAIFTSVKINYLFKKQLYFPHPWPGSNDFYIYPSILQDMLCMFSLP